MKPFELTWRTSPLAGAMHAAAAVQAERTLVDPELGAALEPVVREIRANLVMHRILGRTFFAHLPALAVEYPQHKDLAQITLRKSKGSDAMEYAHLYVEHLRDVQEIFDRFHPANAQELTTRAGPLREQWESRGPGMLMELAQSTEPALITEQAQAILVQPILGGAGFPHCWYNSLRIEAVLANPVQELPEAVRVGWLVGQLQLDLPRYHDDVGLADSQRVGALALVPLALAAAQHVEWCRADAETLELALKTWLPEVDAGVVLEPLLSWWDVYQDRRPPFAKALLALNKLVPAE